MNKSDLKTGMMVVTRNGGEYMVMRNIEYRNSTGRIIAPNIIISESGWMSLYRYSDDLKSMSNGDEFDIVAVFLPLMTPSLCHKDLSDDYYWRCIWKREEPPVEMTVAEIEKKLGIKNLKIIKEKDDEQNIVSREISPTIF
jgi:hypothetical protein